MTKPDFLQNTGITRSSVTRTQERVEYNTEKELFFILSFDTLKTNKGKSGLAVKSLSEIASQIIK